jgi:hypothetical protein
MAKRNAETNEAAGETNGGLVFERLGKDFEIPVVTKGSQFEGPLKQLQALKGEPVKLFSAPPTQARRVYTKAKALKKAAERLGIELDACVRKMGEETCLIASAK